jgi:hypothetical protein
MIKKLILFLILGFNLAYSQTPDRPMCLLGVNIDSTAKVALQSYTLGANTLCEKGLDSETYLLLEGLNWHRNPEFRESESVYTLTQWSRKPCKEVTYQKAKTLNDEGKWYLELRVLFEDKEGGLLFEVGEGKPVVFIGLYR